MSLRVEKGYGSWGREYSPEYWPQEVGLDRLVKLDKEFLNKDSYLQIKDDVPREVLSLIHVQDVTFGAWIPQRHPRRHSGGRDDPWQTPSRGGAGRAAV